VVSDAGHGDLLTPLVERRHGASKCQQQLLTRRLLLLLLERLLLQIQRATRHKLGTFDQGHLLVA